MKITNDKHVVFNSIYKMDKLKNNNESKNKNNTDSIQISDLGKYLSKVNSKEEPMDMEKINRLKNEIESGTYKVDSRILAKKIVEKL
ncbi:flagellar biosynthesis anti-sigma factor FlgM [[Clostridium] bifermentans ATCC 638]|uniref:Negative regulator of flagellin synthesis n=1 Tax=Paraclostridium bifermentans ATCC 638 = DSM 14991 TaxID=1233171 RepID=T4VSB3_PARBF|nr:flagellar biosynthesis anti-sigma factor FlgM [Paraclostridium bifermentans]EQK43641.1 flagellar biosynthesis anti-sigma factor FlgM [[Clostridium] bifermentans ATCC 638] [Paraclostridium bifermentans ATCC 638 = DSM 14991]RIZ59654.1 flagellar biosynthesis anti-sigma factor FlgM [Paraclostridium bifermentans]UAG17484.1 flagellar biosynthesis anti-sigma factor FlgM [Paraclostridium bifermentans]